MIPDPTTGYTPGDIKRSLPAASVVQDTEMTADDNAAPPQEEPMQEPKTEPTYLGRFTQAVQNVSPDADAKGLVARACVVMRASIDRGDSLERQREIEERCVDRLKHGIQPKNTITKAQRMAERAEPPRQQTLAVDPIEQLADEAAQLRLELSSMAAKQKRLAYLETVLEAEANARAAMDGETDA